MSEPTEPPDDGEDPDRWPPVPDERDRDEDLEEVPVLDLEMLPDVVAELSATSDKQTRRVGWLRVDVDRLNDVTTGHEDTLRELQETLAAVEEGLVEKVDLAKPSRWAWPFLTQDEARQLWRETRWFVDWFIGRYPLASELSLPPCWYRHALAVDELSDVYAAWREAYCSGDRPSAAMSSWRDRWLWPALQRLSVYADWRECKETRQHVEPTARQEPTDAGFDEFVDADLAARPRKRLTQLPWPKRQPRQPDHGSQPSGQPAA